LKFLSLNPYNQNILAEHNTLSPIELGEKIDRSKKSFISWKKTSPQFRASILYALADHLEKDLENLSILISSEMGKIQSESRDEILKCVRICRHYALEGPGYLHPIKIPTDALESGVLFEPLGTLLGIMPWNFPFWQVFRFAVPAIMAGNTVLLKHAPNVSLCSKRIEALFLESGLPESVFQSLIIETNLVEGILAHDSVCGLAFTGSEKAGALVASLAGKYLKKCVLELGGSDPFIVLGDAEISSAVKTGIKSRMGNSGQACNGAKRFILEESIYDAFLDEFLIEIKNLVQGDPFSRKTHLGPLARIDLAENLERQIQESLAKGAQWIYQSKREGCNFGPQVFTGVLPGMPIFDEETFGPLVSIIRVKNQDEALEMANQTRYGLGAAVFTRDMRRAREWAQTLESGNVFINAQVRSDPRLPFGGIKKSGYGRELAQFGMMEFMNLKTYYIDSSK
jgi:succinate-semialdehyde dehydrogenase/glutarate-semialdehyde dehydrogenase